MVVIITKFNFSLFTDIVLIMTDLNLCELNTKREQHICKMIF